jgi:uncharacterized membrane protein
MTRIDIAREDRFTASYNWAGYALGFALGGFFDGILLHQILQWHHLLSGLANPALADIRVQILADGVFHLLMYAVAFVGLVLLWRRKNEFAASGADRRLFANALIGFGVWHIVDAVLSHWLLGIHRIRMDSANPLVWDLLWFAVFGVLFVVAGYVLRRRRGGERFRPGNLAAMLAGIAVLAGGAAALPPRDASAVLVVLGPAATPASAFAALQRANGRLVWSDASDTVWAVELVNGGAGEFYRSGALFVSGSFLQAGCLNWTRI